MTTTEEWRVAVNIAHNTENDWDEGKINSPDALELLANALVKHGDEMGQIIGTIRRIGHWADANARDLKKARGILNA